MANKESNDWKGGEPKSDLRTGQIGVASSGLPVKPKCLYSKHKHIFHREHVSASKVLTNNTMYVPGASNKLPGVHGEGKQMWIPLFVFETVNSKNTEEGVENPKNLWINYIDLTSIIKVSEIVKFQHHIPSQCLYSDIPTDILVNCSRLIFSLN